MHIEGSGISCGVRRLIVEAKDNPTKEALTALINPAKAYCAMVMAGIPTKRRDVIALLLDSDFEQVKNPNKTERKIEPDDSVNTVFADMASLIMYHDHESDEADDSLMFEQFVDSTISNSMTDMANLILHHGSEITGNLSFFVHYTNKKLTP